MHCRATELLSISPVPSLFAVYGILRPLECVNFSSRRPLPPGHNHEFELSVDFLFGQFFARYDSPSSRRCRIVADIFKELFRSFRFADAIGYRHMCEWSWRPSTMSK